jgi:hypothetical protein
LPELSPAAASAAIESAFPLIRSELDKLVRIPSVSAAGIDAPSVAGAVHQIVPWARAGISVRLAPGDNAERAFRALKEHLQLAQARGRLRLWLHQGHHWITGPCQFLS